jgi:hypothetical protein
MTYRLAPSDHIAVGANTMNLKNRLCDVETDCRNRLHGPVLRIGSPHGDHGTYVPVEEPASEADVQPTYIPHAPIGRARLREDRQPARKFATGLDQHSCAVQTRQDWPGDTLDQRATAGTR